MEKKQKDLIGTSSTDDYDFSLECPLFRKRLYAKFMKRANADEAIPLSDEELTMLNAAGQMKPPKER